MYVCMCVRVYAYLYIIYSASIVSITESYLFQLFCVHLNRM